MRNNILMFSHNTHSFLNNEIQYASNTFKKVVIISPYSKEIEEIVSNLSNVNHIFYNKKTLKKIRLKFLYKFINNRTINEVVESLKCKKLSISYLKRVISFLTLEKLFDRIITNEIGISEENASDWVFYSAWYYGTAYAMTQAKKKYLNVKVISLAHSFEIDKEKNQYTKLLFRKLYHPLLDRVSFISKNVCEMYQRDIANSLSLSLENVHVNYLGTKKLYLGKNFGSKDQKLRIVSCSHMVPIKRIDLIFNSLDTIENLEIEWTHFGDGVEMNKIKEMVESKSNMSLKVNLIGSKENKEIHEYYINNPIDIFINTSASEGIPVTIMEALAYGIPVIATDVGGNSEIVKDTFGKVISKNASILEIKKAILSLNNLSTEKKDEMRIAARKYYEDNFNSDKIREDFFFSLSRE